MFFDASEYSTKSIGKSLRKRKWDNSSYSYRSYAFYRRYDWEEPDYPQIDEDEIDPYLDGVIRSFLINGGVHNIVD